VSPRHLRVLAASAALALVLAACGGDADVVERGDEPTGGATTDAGATPTEDATDPAAPSPTPTEAAAGTVLEFTVAGGEVTGGEDRATVPVGDEVTIHVTADGDDEIHVHGYDLHQDVVAGEEATLTFTADIPGVFEVELEDSGLVLTKLEVR
jgi:hypothetical protein